MRLTLISTLVACGISTVYGDASITKFPNSLNIPLPHNPVQNAYWTDYAHHRRKVFAVSPDEKSAYLAYLDSTLKTIVIQQVDTTTFTAVGTAITFAGKEAAGLVAHNDGFAIMATVAADGTTDIPPNNYPIVKLFRYTNGVRTWATALNGPGVHPADGLTATPDANGDLVYNEKTGLYGAYFVVTAYTGWASGHFGDSIQYVNNAGALQNIPQSSTFGCSHNTGIALEAADEVPYASICAEDHGSIWLNTDTRTMNGIKIANENVTNGASGEPMGGMGGSYSNLARFPGSTNYVFAWQSRGSIKLTPDAWMGNGYVQSSPRWLNHNVAIATMSAKNKLTGPQAISTVGAAEGDLQVNWITKSSTDAHANVRVAALNGKQAIVTWETMTSPRCEAVPMGCTGTFSGTSFQVIDSAGAKVGGVVSDKTLFVAGDIVNIGTDRVCWPYDDIVWDLSAPRRTAGPVSKISFACASLGGGSSSPAPVSSSSTTTSRAPATTPVVPVIVPTTTTTGNIRPASTTPVVNPVPVPTTPPVVIPAPSSTTSNAPVVTSIRTTTFVTRTTTRTTSKTTTRTTKSKKSTTTRKVKTTRTPKVKTPKGYPTAAPATTTVSTCPRTKKRSAAVVV